VVALQPFKLLAPGLGIDQPFGDLSQRFPGAVNLPLQFVGIELIALGQGVVQLAPCPSHPDVSGKRSRIVRRHAVSNLFRPSRSDQRQFGRQRIPFCNQWLNRMEASRILKCARIDLWVA